MPLYHNITNDTFWSDDPNVLFRKSEFMLFFPTSKMTPTQQLNSLTRLSLYLSIIMFLYSGKLLYLSIFLITCILTYAMHRQSTQKMPTGNTTHHARCYADSKEEGANKMTSVVEPTHNNPFMNVLMTDYTDNPCREAVTDNPSTDVTALSKNVDEKFNVNLYKDLSDVFDKMNSQRQFYTMPVTTIPNKQGNFADWCFGRPETCKEGNGEQCLQNIHTHLEPIHHTKIYA